MSDGRTDGLPATERSDPATAGIDELPTAELARTLIRAHQRALDAALGAADAIARAVAAVAAALGRGGTVFVYGAGTSGRLAVLDAAELPPTFGVAADLVQARIAGGDVALRSAVEGAEDDAAAGAVAAADSRPGDVAIGVSASGTAAYVRAALTAARAGGALTIGIVNSPGAGLAAQADIGIVLETGAEPIAGSTRLIAGTAQKIALNTISTAAMIGLGKTFGNQMIDVVATNAKLQARAVRLVRQLTNDPDPAALLARAGGRVKTAVVMAYLTCDRSRAEGALRAAGGRLAAIIGPAA